MANTYTQIHLQLVFAVKNRASLIQKKWKDDLEKYITGIVENNEHKLLAIGSMPDHIHIFIGYNPKQLIPDLVSEIKISSNNWIKLQKLSPFKFDWQKGYGAFSYSKSQVEAVVNYVLNQEAHHFKKTFREEYSEILINVGVEFDNKYLFDFFEGQ
jgi:putative transposase